MSTKILYMAYGSNLNLEQMSRLCPNSRMIEKTRLEGYRLVFRGEDGKAFLNIEKEEGQSVPVMIWEIDQADELSLDGFENFPIQYHKKYKQMEVEGKTQEVMVYIMNWGEPLGRPSESYYRTVEDGYFEADFDQAELEEALRYSTE